MEYISSLMGLDEHALAARVRDGMASQAVDAAIAVMSDAHRDTFRDEGTPYVRHPLRVALILLEELGVADADLTCAALLHDVLEEEPTVVDAAALDACFSARVTDLVRCLTDEFRHAGLIRQERKRLYLQRIARECDDCILVKLCDRVDNLRSLRYANRPDKQRQMVADTEIYLLPLVDGRGGTFVRLGELLRHAIHSVDLP